MKNATSLLGSTSEWRSVPLYRSGRNVFLMYQSRDIDFPHETVALSYPLSAKEPLTFPQVKHELSRANKMLLITVLLVALVALALSLDQFLKKFNVKSPMMVQIKQATDYLNTCEFCKQFNAYSTIEWVDCTFTGGPSYFLFTTDNSDPFHLYQDSSFFNSLLNPPPFWLSFLYNNNDYLVCLGKNPLVFDRSLDIKKERIKWLYSKQFSNAIPRFLHSRLLKKKTCQFLGSVHCLNSQSF